MRELSLSRVPPILRASGAPRMPPRVTNLFGLPGSEGIWGTQDFQCENQDEMVTLTSLPMSTQACLTASPELVISKRRGGSDCWWLDTHVYGGDFIYIYTQLSSTQLSKLWQMVTPRNITKIKIWNILTIPENSFVPLFQSIPTAHQKRTTLLIYISVDTSELDTLTSVATELGKNLK